MTLSATVTAKSGIIFSSEDIRPDGIDSITRVSQVISMADKIGYKELAEHIYQAVIDRQDKVLSVPQDISIRDLDITIDALQLCVEVIRKPLDSDPFANAERVAGKGQNLLDLLRRPAYAACSFFTYSQRDKKKIDFSIIVSDPEGVPLDNDPKSLYKSGFSVGLYKDVYRDLREDVFSGIEDISYRDLEEALTDSNMLASKLCIGRDEWLYGEFLDRPATIFVLRPHLKCRIAYQILRNVALGGRVGATEKLLEVLQEKRKDKPQDILHYLTVAN